MNTTAASNLGASQFAPIYRPMTSEDIATAHRMSLAVSWPHRPEDWQFALDNGTGFAAELNGALIGTAICWKHGPERASLGLVIVSDAYQGRGIGRTLMQKMLDEVGTRVTFLHATPAGQPLYEKLGFQVCGTLNQHQGRVTETLKVELPDGVQLRDAQSADIASVTALATRATGLERDAMLAALFEEGRGLVLEREGVMIGFSVFRRFGRGYVVGPVVAAHSADDIYAKALIGHWLAGRENEYIRVDLPAGSTVDAWLAEQGLPCVDSVVKMVRNAPAEAHIGSPDPELRWYALLSQAMF